MYDSYKSMEPCFLCELFEKFIRPEKWRKIRSVLGPVR